MMIKKVCIIGVVLAIASYSCNKGNSYDVTGGGLEFRIERRNETGTRVKEGDYLVMDVKYFTPADSLLFSSTELPGKFRMKSKKPTYGNGRSIDDALLTMNEGDSTSFLLDAASFYQNTRHDSCPKSLIGKKLRFEIALREIQSEEEVATSKRELAQKREKEELDLLDAFMQNNYPGAKPDSSGMYTIVVGKSDGKKPRVGQKVSVNYVARLIDGKTLDNTYKRKELFSFTLGAREVIEGLERGLLTQPKGSRVIYIIPSKLAYGPEGNKSVPPCSTIIFEVELVKIEGE